MFGTPFAFVTQHLALAPWIPGAAPSAKVAITAAGIAFLLYLANLLLSFALPEPQQADLPE